MNARDGRMLGLGLAGWLAVAGCLAVGPTGVVVLAILLGAVALRRLDPVLARPWVGAVWVVVLAAVATTQLHAERSAASPVRSLAAERAVVTAWLTVRSQPVRSDGRFGPRLRFDARVDQVVGRGRTVRTHDRVVVLIEGAGAVPRYGARIKVAGRLAPSDGASAALLFGRGPPSTVAPPRPVDRAVARVRQGVRDAAAPAGGGAAALVPALVDGDEGAAGGTQPFADAFQVAGMTHLLAVSGTNLTLILGGMLLVARWCRVRGRGLILSGLVGVVGFVLLAGPEPSVLRAAAMGSIAVLGLGRHGPGRGLRTLGLGVLLLVLLDPGLALSVGFTLSVVATGAILLLVPGWTAALSRWLPAPVAAAIAVPLAAQVACTPVVAAISGQVSLVSIGANLVAAPLVGPATVLGLAGGLLTLVWVPAGQLLAVPAGWSAAGIIAIARFSSSLPVPALAWPATPFGIAALTAGCALAAARLGRVLARRGPCLAVAAATLLAVLVPVPTPGWPPRHWLLIACDVGQGDALVLNAGPGAGVVVDAGPDPGAVTDCLRRLGIERVPVLVLTHFHADHIDGIGGVLRGRQVGRIEVSPLAEPAGGALLVRRAADRAGIVVRTPALGERTSVGRLRWQVLAPARLHPDSDSPPNDASLVLLVEYADVRLLLLGDEEPASQADLRRARPDLRADVVKVAHHGSSRQDAALLDQLDARVALISSGRDNDYGHPAPRTLDLLGRAGLRVLRTDRDGDIAVVVRPDGSLATASRGRGLGGSDGGP